MKTDNFILPQPEHPLHVENLNKISLLKAQGFGGQDASLEINLFEYGCIWKQTGTELIVIYKLPDTAIRFDRCTFKNDLDLRKEFNWVNWPEFLAYFGNELTFEEWDTLPLGQKIYDLYTYYGAEGIFGSSYWEGFKITKN